LDEIDSFRHKFPETSYYQTTRIMEARSQHGLGKYKDAIDLYEKIQASTLDKNQKLWAQARYESSFSFEELGDSVSTLAILFGLERVKAPLSEEVEMAELPARIAGIYFEQGRDKEAREYLDKADRGLKILISEKGIENNRRRFSEVMYRMGSVITPHITLENFPRVLKAHRNAQIYLIRAMELNVPTWSQRAADDLIATYRNYWHFIQTQWSGPEDRPVRVQAFKNLHTLISESIYRQPAEPAMWNDSLRAYFSFADQLEKEISANLFASGETTIMTEKTPATGIQTIPMPPQPDIVSPDPNM
jgi:tetratricopeptide (TPR) repeat protein